MSKSMLKKYTCITAFISFLALTAGAQQDTRSGRKRSWGFNSINQFGMLAGEKGSDILLQSVNGVRYKTWFLGAGIGLDTYYAKTVPLFLSIRKSLLNRSNTPFLYVDGGIQVMAEKNNLDKDIFGWHSYDPGAYYDLGLGYYIGLKNKDAVLMTIGYSGKELEFTDYSGRYDYKFKRFSLKVGYRL